MVTLYGYTILADMALLAIVIAIFVFASSFYRVALELSAKEEEASLNRRKEFIVQMKKELIVKTRDADEKGLTKRLRAELDKFDSELSSIDKSMLAAQKRGKSLALKNMVSIPSLFLLISIIASGIAIATSGILPNMILPNIMWGLSLALVAVSLCLTYRNLSRVEFFSGAIDLSVLMELALERHRMKSAPILEMELLDFQLEIQRGETEEIVCFVSLKQGYIGKNARVRFSGTEELDFPDEKIEQVEYDYHNMRKPKQFWHEIGDVNPKVYKQGRFKVKAPDHPGEYTMAYWLECDEFASEEETFTIKVI